jgi:ElaB/YqjD/DUF883 family membrane-anchored ribosome-binding protein
MLKAHGITIAPFDAPKTCGGSSPETMGKIMDQNERGRGNDLGMGGDELNDSSRGEPFGSGMTGSAGPANTPSFGEPSRPDADLGRSGGLESSSHRGHKEEGDGSRLEEGKEIVTERMEAMRNRVEGQLDDGMQTAADRMEGIAHRLDEVADDRMSGEGLRGKAGNVAHKVADRIEDTAGYLRNSDAHDLLGRLESQVRERPLEMLLAGVATGWLVGKILR